jgi:hypothetical protein
VRSNKYAHDVYDCHQAIDDLKGIVCDRVAAAERAIRAEMQEQFQKAHAALAAAKQKYDAEQAVLDAEAAAEASGDDRIGRIYVEWVPNYPFSRERKLSGKRGICEVFTAEMRATSAHPTRQPEPGRLIVRHLKKNGERAKTFDVFSFFHCSDGNASPPLGWHLEGETPPK